MKKVIDFLIFIIMMTLNTQSSYAKGDTTLLHYLTRPPKVQIQKPPLLILLHGVGSNEQDLFRIANDLPDNFLVISARAPFTISEGRYKWYDVDFSSGVPRFNVEQAEKSRLTIINFINQLKEKHSFNEEEIYLCGFSQGAIMSFSVGLTRPDKVKGIIALSGRVLSEIKPNIADEGKLKSLKTLIIHGKNDEVLSINYAHQSKSLLDSLHIQNDYFELNMGHTITSEVIEIINKWLKKSE
jgi:phospholipase/carboxylesterase